MCQPTERALPFLQYCFFTLSLYKSRLFFFLLFKMVSGKSFPPFSSSTFPSNHLDSSRFQTTSNFSSSVEPSLSPRMHQHLFSHDLSKRNFSFPSEKLSLPSNTSTTSAACSVAKGRRRWVKRGLLFLVALCVSSLLLSCSTPFPQTWLFKTKTNQSSSTSTTVQVTSQNPIQDETDWSFAKKVSIVYTWVNGSEPLYKAQRAEFGGQKAIDGDRDRDNDDLLFSLRALETNMPWHQGEIIIVSPSPPRWLNTKNKRVRWVDQNSIVPKQFQPTFNTNVIESFLHLIPGLTDRFIQINDDTMISKPLEPSEFFTPDGGVQLFLENGVIRPPDVPVNKIWVGAVHRTVRILREAYGNEETGEIENDPPRFLKHAPFVYWKKALEEVHALFREELEETYTHPFRHARDVITPLFHHTFLTQEGKQNKMPWSIAPSSEATLLQWTTDLYHNADKLDEALDQDPAFITFNDELGHNDRSRDFRRAQRQLRMVYNEICGSQKSQFEI